MDEPEELKLKLKTLEQKLDDAIWEDKPHYVIKKIKEEISLVKLKLEMGDTHDRSF